MLSPRAWRFASATFCWKWAETEEKKAKGENIWATARLPASIAAGPLLHCTPATGRNLGAEKKPGGGRLIVSILDSQSSVGSAKSRKMRFFFLIAYFVDSRMIPLRPGLSALFVIWCAKRHRCPPLLPLGSKIRGGAAGGSFIFLFLGKLAALVFWAFVGRDVPISLQFSA